MPTGLIGYQPELIHHLRHRTTAVAHHLAHASSDDPAAAPAIGVARLVRAHLDDDWLPLLERITACAAMTLPLDVVPPGDGRTAFHPAGGTVIADVVDRLTDDERRYFQGFVKAYATEVATELAGYDAHPDYASDHLPAALTTLDSTRDWGWLAQLYLVERYHRLVEHGDVELRRDGDADWIDPIDLADTRSIISGDLVLAAIAVGGGFRKGTGLSPASAETLTSPLPAPRRLTPPTEITGYTRHGLERVMANDDVGVAPRAILETVRHPASVDERANGTFRYEGRHALVVLNAGGEVVTAWAVSRQGWRTR